MLAELSIVALGNVHQSAAIVDAIKLVETSGVAYQVTPMGTCVEGDWDELMQLMKRCHASAGGHSPHVLIKFEY